MNQSKVVGLVSLGVIVGAVLGILFFHFFVELPIIESWEAKAKGLEINLEQMTKVKESLEAEKTSLKANITFLESEMKTKIETYEAEIFTLTSNYEKSLEELEILKESKQKFRSEASSIMDSLKKKSKLVEEILNVHIYVLRHDLYYPEDMMDRFEPLVNTINDKDLNSAFARMKKNWDEWNPTEFYDAYGDFEELAKWLLQRDMIKLETLLKS